jgi:hypothetical protein
MPDTTPQPYNPPPQPTSPINGTNGTNGTNGLDGNTIMYGTSDPSPTDGKNGDTYINTQTNKIFTNKTASGWPVGVPLIGPQGLQGIPGLTGAASAIQSIGLNPPVGYQVQNSPLTTSGNMSLVTMPTTIAASVATVSNSTAETILFTSSIAAGSMNTGGSIRFKLVCELSSGLVNPTITMRVKFGSGVLVAMATATISVSLTNKPFVIEGTITNLSATNAQYAVAEVKQGSALTIMDTIVGASWAIDTTSAQTFQITSQFGTALTGTTLTPKTMSMFIR